MSIHTKKTQAATFSEAANRRKSIVKSVTRTQIGVEAVKPQTYNRPPRRALSKPVLSLDSDNERKCLLCEGRIAQKDKTHSLTNRGWENLKQQAQVWKEINIDLEDKFHFFRYVHDKIVDKTDAFGNVHDSCRLPFRTKASAYVKRYYLLM